MIKQKVIKLFNDEFGFLNENNAQYGAIGICIGSASSIVVEKV